MTVNEYLEAILRDQTLTRASEELITLRKRRSEVETLLKGKFTDSSPTIRYGGSKAKGTMIKASYDLDMTCYFEHEDDNAGQNLGEIYQAVDSALQDAFYTEPKTSVIRVRHPEDLTDFHIDVVPGRFVAEDKRDVFIYQASAEKARLKTNLDVHISHIRDSGVVDAIRLNKFWRQRVGMDAKTFVLELLVVDLLKNRKTANLEKQLTHVWTQFRDKAEELSVVDPANPTGNDLTAYVDGVCAVLSSAAASALMHVENDNWGAIFGPVSEESDHDRTASLTRIAATVTAPKKPWHSGR